MTEQVLGQVFSILGMVITIVSFQMKHRKQILMMQTAGSAFFLISFLFLQSWAAVYLNIVYLARNIIFYFRNDAQWARHKVWLFVLLIAVVAAGSLGYRTPWDILPIVGSIFGTVAAYMKNENMFRLFKLGDSPCWLIYNISVPSVGGSVCEVFNLISITIGLIRYRKKGFIADAKEGSETND